RDAAAREALAHLVAGEAHHHHGALGRQRRGGAQHVLEQRPPGRLVQHLGQRRAHTLPLPRRQHHHGEGRPRGRGPLRHPRPSPLPPALRLAPPSAPPRPLPSAPRRAGAWAVAPPRGPGPPAATAGASGWARTRASIHTATAMIATLATCVTVNSPMPGWSRPSAR